MHVAVLGTKHAPATDPRLFLLFFPSTSWRASKCSHEACQIVPIESRPLLTEQPMPPPMRIRSGLRVCMRVFSFHGVCWQPAGVMWCMREDGAGLYVCLVMLQERAPTVGPTGGFGTGGCSLRCQCPATALSLSRLVSYERTQPVGPRRQHRPQRQADTWNTRDVLTFRNTSGI